MAEVVLVEVDVGGLGSSRTPDARERETFPCNQLHRIAWHCIALHGIAWPFPVFFLPCLVRPVQSFPFQAEDLHHGPCPLHSLPCLTLPHLAVPPTRTPEKCLQHHTLTLLCNQVLGHSLIGVCVPSIKHLLSRVRKKKG
jgi:hypothetical protein